MVLVSGRRTATAGAGWRRGGRGGGDHSGTDEEVVEVPYKMPANFVPASLLVFIICPLPLSKTRVKKFATKRSRGPTTVGVVALVPCPTRTTKTTRQAKSSAGAALEIVLALKRVERSMTGGGKAKQKAVKVAKQEAKGWVDACVTVAQEGLEMTRKYLEIADGGALVMSDE